MAKKVPDGLRASDPAESKGSSSAVGSFRAPILILLMITLGLGVATVLSLLIAVFSRSLDGFSTRVFAGISAGLLISISYLVLEGIIERRFPAFFIHHPTARIFLFAACSLAALFLCEFTFFLTQSL